MKSCRKCGVEKELSEYYRHAQMKDGHLNICKPCTRARVADHRERNLDRIREYDRGRGSRQGPEYFKEYRQKFPKKYKANVMINNALRSGKMRKKPCEVCGGGRRIEAHHDDYDYPLEVRWLCSAHHKQWHRDNGPGLNGE